MIDFNSLCEFEDALSQEPATNITIILETLESRIEYKRAEDGYGSQKESCDQSSPEVILHRAFAEYEIEKDEFATCSGCGGSLAIKENYKRCCELMSEQSLSIGSRLEESFWVSLLQNPTSTINTFPHYTEFLCLKKGIPNPIRSLIWNKLFLLNSPEPPQSSKLIFKNFQHSYSLEVSEQIAKDLNRTFPNVKFFNQKKTINDLSTILNVYANYDFELGYCQGLIFLVGVLYYHLRQDNELVFYALVNVMETEPEVHDIFAASTMAGTLNNWYHEFLFILQQADIQLHDHLTSFVDPQVFLYQWWLSFMSSHSPDLSIVNRIIDFCMFQGWKRGLLKVTLGLLICNKPLLMAMGKGDEEVVYQHLLNESKWGNAINNLEYFFSDLLFSWDSELFLTKYKPTTIGKAPSPNVVLSPLKTFVTNLRSLKNSAGHLKFGHEAKSLQISSSSWHNLSDSDFTDDLENSPDTNSSIMFSKHSNNSTLFGSIDHMEEENLRAENESLKDLLKKAYSLIEPNSLEAISLRNDILKVC